MKSRDQWVRVTPKNRCPICGKDTWCLIHREVVLCMRVVSNRPKLLKSGETGYLHKPNEPVNYHPPPPRPVVSCVDCLGLLTRYRASATRGTAELAKSLGVSERGVHRLGAVWATDKRAWAFPMRDGHGAIVGIRLRADDGRKWAVTGSHQGCFIPYGAADKFALICEGPTDTAAGLTLGYYAIGRPSCSGGVTDIVRWTRHVGVTRVAIIADNDDPGLNGARTLANQLGTPTCTIVLPTKDLRKFVQMGGTKPVLDNLINGSVWRNP